MYQQRQHLSIGECLRNRNFYQDTSFTSGPLYHDTSSETVGNRLEPLKILTDERIERNGQTQPRKEEMST